MFPYPIEEKHLLTRKRSFTRSDVFFRTAQRHVIRLLSHLESRKLFFDIVCNQVKHELKGGKDIIQQLLQAEPRENGSSVTVRYDQITRPQLPTNIWTLCFHQIAPVKLI